MFRLSYKRFAFHIIVSMTFSRNIRHLSAFLENFVLLKLFLFGDSYKNVPVGNLSISLRYFTSARWKAGGILDEEIFTGFVEDQCSSMSDAECKSVMNDNITKD